MYDVQCLPETPGWLAEAAARIAYDHPKYPWAARQFTPQEYIRLVRDDTDGYPVLAAYSGLELVAALSFTELMKDPHCPGSGSFVMYSVAKPEHPGAAGVLLRALRRMLRDAGADWYQISKRLDADTVLSKYRRLHEQENQESA